MPFAETRLELLQLNKLMQLLRSSNRDQIPIFLRSALKNILNCGMPESGETPLLWAVANRNEELVRFLLEKGAHPDIADLKMQTPVIRAVKLGAVGILKILVNAGADLTLKDSEGKAAIFFCLTSSEEHATCASILLEYGAPANNVDNYGRVAFVMSCEGGEDTEETCLLMLKAGAEPNLCDKASGKSPLIAACAECNDTVALALLEAGALTATADRKGVTAAMAAAENKNLDALVALSAWGDRFSGENPEGDTVLHIAARQGVAKICRFLTLRGCDARRRNNEGLTPKMLAKDSGFKAATNELKKAEKLPDSTLMQAGLAGANSFTEADAVRLYDWTVCYTEKLLEMFQEHDKEDSGNISADIFWQCMNSLKCPINPLGIKRIQQLHDLQKQDVINYDEFIKGTKYIPKQFRHGAVEKKKKKKVKKTKKVARRAVKATKVIMPICINENIPKSSLGFPEDMVMRNSAIIFCAKLDSLGSISFNDTMWYDPQPTKSYVHFSIVGKMGELTLLKEAIESGELSLNVRDKYFRTPLIVACADGDLKLVELLLNYGANLHLGDNFCWRPLHHACHIGHTDIVKLLLDRGADMDAQTMSGATPLMKAIEMSHIDIVALLISIGADLYAECRNGSTAMKLAKEWAHPDIIACLEAAKEAAEAVAPQGKTGKEEQKGKSSKKQTKVNVARSVPAHYSAQQTPKIMEQSTLTDIIAKRKMRRRAHLQRAKSNCIEHVSTDLDNWAQDISFSYTIHL